MTLLLVSFGAFWITETAKAVLPPLHPWVKMMVAAAAASLPALLLADWTDRAAALAFAGAGLAAVTHKAHRLLSALGDAQQVAVMMKASRSGRRGG